MSFRIISFIVVLLIPGISVSYDFEGFVEGQTAGDQFGEALCTVDFNDDGYPDLVVGASARDEAGLSSGKVYIYYGGPGADLTADLSMIGVASSFYGQAVASAGDFNADGAEDLLVGAPFYDVPGDNAGAVFLYFGGSTPDTAVDHIFTGEAAGDYFGTSVSGVGDFNNDSYDDFAVGAYRADWGTFSLSGKAYIYYGGPSPDFVVDRVLVGEADGERFGWSLTGGDFDGDGFADIASGAYSWDSTEINQGRIYVFRGGTNPDSLFDFTLSGNAAGLKYGWSLSTGRVTSDSNDDLVMGTDGFEFNGVATGRAYVFDGGPGFDGVPAFTYDLAQTTTDQLGDAVVSGVDIDENGSDEVLIGMPGNTNNTGGMVVVAGGSTIDVDSTIHGAAASEALGRSVTLWADYGGSGQYAVVGGAPEYNSFLGRIHVYTIGDASPANQPPSLDPIDPQLVIAGNQLSFTVSASDPDGTIPDILAENVPGTASFSDNNDGTGDFDWLTTTSDTGIYSVRFIATDGIASDTATVSIQVVDSACCTGSTGNVNYDPENKVDISDLTALVNHLFVTFEPLPCPFEANVNGDSEGKIDISDLTKLVNHLFVTFEPTAPCP